MEPAAPGIGGAGPASKVPLKGVLFTLPKTQIQLDLVVERTQQVQGEFCEFNDLFWPGVKETVKCDASKTEPESEITVTGASVATKGVPDPALRFELPLGAEASIDSADNLEMSEQGNLTGAESSRTDRRGEFALSVISALAGIAGKLAAGTAKLGDSVGDKDFLDSFLKFKDANGNELTWLIENYTMLKKDRQQELADISKKSGQGDLRYSKLWRARRAFITIVQLQAGQTDLLTATQGGLSGVPDIVKANKEEATKLIGQAFLGFERKVTWNPGFEMVPDVNRPANWGGPRSLTLFKKGTACVPEVSPLLNKNPLIAQLKCKTAPALSAPVELRLEADGMDQLARTAEQYYDRPAEPSYPFIIPGRVKATIAGDQSSPMPPPIPVLLAQWGSVHQLPVGKTSKAKNMKVTYYEATGALKSVKFGSDSAFRKDVVDSLSASANTVLDAKLKADAAADAAAAKQADELLKLQRRRQILEEQEKIQTLCTKLGIECSN